MKTRLLSLVILVVAMGQANAQNLYESLKGVNTRWAFEHDIPEVLYELPAEENPIQAHLFWVHRILSERSTDHLNPEQLKNRNNSLQHLAEYAKAGVFPKNLYHPQRQPVFIDPFNTYCAVGHLIKESGNDPLARSISREMNYAYLLDMKMDKLDNWVAQSGFTPEELAWIQPGYPALQAFETMEEGVNGPVNAIHAYGSWEVVAAGNFDTAGVVQANNISTYIAGIAGYDWIPFGSPNGVSGQVMDMEEMNSNLIIAGDIWAAGTTSVGAGVVEWDGTQWNALGSFYVGALPNIVYDVEVYNNELYAAGFFRSEVTAPTTFRNFAKWDGSQWVALGSPNGTVKELFVHNGELVLGGDFTDIDGVTYNHIATFDGTVFGSLGNGVPTSVNAMEEYQGNLYVGCDLLSSSQQDTFAMGYFDGSQWTRLIGEPWQFTTQTNLHEVAIKCLQTTPFGLFAGGKISYPNFGTYGQNILRYHNGYIEGFGILDASVNALNYTPSGELYLGGDFNHAFGIAGMMFLNHITKVDIIQLFSVEDPLKVQTKLFPNPASQKVELSFDNPVEVEAMQLSSITGQSLRIPYQEEGQGRYSIDVSSLAAGTHVLTVHTDAGVLEKKLVIAR